MSRNDTSWTSHGIPLGPVEMGTQTFCVLLSIVCFLSVYTFSSVVLLYYPSLLHRRKHLAFVLPRHISHRGGAGERIESTLSAFRHAYSQGTEMFEVDTQMTADGRVVVCHDDDLKRLTGADAKISKLNYADLPLLRPTQTLHFYHKSHVTQAPRENEDGANEGGGTGGTHTSSGGRAGIPKSPSETPLTWSLENETRKVMLLSELFAEFPTTPINIDTKSGDAKMLEKISTLVKESQREHLTVWGNMDESITSKCYEINPNIPVFFSFRRSLLAVLCYFLGLLPFLPMKESCFEVMMPSIFLNKCSGGGMENPGAFSRFVTNVMDLLLMRPGLIAHLARRGIPTFLWVLNDDEDFYRAFVQVGCAGVMTDFPSKLRRYLEENAVAFDPKVGCVSKRDKGDVSLV